jgi:hypothetical protein
MPVELRNNKVKHILHFPGPSADPTWRRRETQQSVVPNATIEDLSDGDYEDYFLQGSQKIEMSVKIYSTSWCHVPE